MRYIILAFLLACGQTKVETMELCEYATELREACEKQGGLWTEQIFMETTWILFCDMGDAPEIQECCACEG